MGAPPSKTILLRGSQWSPLSVPDCKLWLKADALALADGAAVATWPDLSPSRNDASQGTAGYRPVFKAGVVNGRAAVLFDTADDSLSTGAYGYALNGNGLTIAVLASIGGTTGNYNGIITNRVSGSGDWLTFGEHNSDKIYIEGRLSGGVTNVNTAVNDRGTGVHVYLLAKDAASYSLRRDGVSIASGASDIGGGSLTSLVWTLGQWFATGQNLGGYIAEVAVYHRLLSSAEQGKLERYLGRRYGIVIP